jgi:chromate reductase
MQYHLRQRFVFLNMYPLNLPEVMITHSAQRFDEQRNLVDEPTRDLMRKFLQALVLWARQVEHGKQIQA